MTSLPDSIRRNKYLSTFSKAVEAAGLEPKLSAAGPFTIFAPSELAFSKLYHGDLPELMQADHREQLVELLQGHITEGSHPFSKLTNGKKLMNLNGKMLEITLRNGYTNLNDAAVQDRDLICSNGILHTVGSLIR